MSIIVGKWFHSFDNGYTKWQGQVIASVHNDEYYLVQLYDFIMGEPSIQKLVSLQDMLLWQFYDTNEQMKDEYCNLSLKDTVLYDDEIARKSCK